MRSWLLALLLLALLAVAFAEESQSQDEATGKPKKVSSKTPRTRHVAPKKKKHILRKNKTIQGRIKLNGKFYETKCKCADSEWEALTKCLPPRLMRVRQEPFNQMRGLSKLALKEVLGKPEGLRKYMWDAATSSLSCVEGRDPSHLLGTPGGDWAEFLHALSEFEIITKEQLTQDLVTTYFKKWLDYAPRGPALFYYHTDSAAVLRVQQKLHVGGSSDKVVGLELDAPEARWRETISQLLKQSRFHGCTYIKAILDEPERFYLRRELPGYVVTAFFHTLWDKTSLASDGQPYYQKLNFVTLDGMAGEEKAWVNIQASHNCEKAHRAPAFRPHNSLAPVFVHHPQAVDVHRETYARFFAAFADGLSAKDLLQRYRHRGAQTLQVAAEVLGSSVPFYTVTVE